VGDGLNQVSLLDVHDAEFIVGVRIGFEAKGGFKLSRSRGKVPLHKERTAGSPMGVSILAVEAQYLVKVADRFSRVVPGEKRVAQIVVRADIVRLDPQGLTELADRLFKVDTFAFEAALSTLASTFFDLSRQVAGPFALNFG
jgi:hypothetical protein